MNPRVKCFGLLLVLTFSAFLTHAQAPRNGYYVVIAAYASSKEDYAERFKNSVSDTNEKVKYVFFKNKNMYFVYLDYFADRSPSLTHMQMVRKNTDFDDAWVYVFKDEEATEANIVTNSDDTVQIVAENEEENAEEEIIVEEEVVVVEEEEIVEEVEEEEAEVAKLGKYKVYLQITHDRTAEILDGSVDVIDPSSGKLVTELLANNLYYLDPPNRNNEEIQFEVELFGFRKSIHTVDLSDPETEETEFEVAMRGDTTYVFFDLIKFRKGDRFTMYHVYFFTSSAVMRPESQNELTDLLFLMQNNPDNEILLHGFVNGNGKILGSKFHTNDDTNFFTMEGVEVKDMSAKELSEMRAQAVKNYLVFNGISPDRISVKGWGGKKALYKVTDPRADKNVRVEVEIL